MSSKILTNRVAPFLLLVVGVLTNVSAQSIDPNSPTPVRSNSLIGRIAARDLGDARLTDHYYAFRGHPGDLLITIRSTNLNGDIDVFTAGTLRPLLKLTLYAESTAPVTKGIYLRRTEDLVLRVEARSPNDDDGTYDLQFGGTFEPIQGGPEIAENETPAAPTANVPSSGRKTKRVSSVGARIEEPPPPVTEVATANPTPEPTPEPSPIESPSPRVTEKPAEPVPAPRTTRSRRPTTRRTTTAVAKPKETPVKEAAAEEPKNVQAAESAEPEPKSTAPARTKSRRTRAPEPATKPAESEPQPEAEVGPRLIIETNDGTVINRSMSRVRRVTIENGQVVVVGKDGAINRILLANVVKMSIEP
ncbi:MAG TPA: hypothetical protein VIG25_01420 [Pyrinomonadaceae bacterium]